MKKIWSEIRYVIGEVFELLFIGVVSILVAVFWTAIVFVPIGIVVYGIYKAVELIVS